MKVLTVNIHSHYNKMTALQFDFALTHLSEMILKNQIDVIALQECGQTCDADPVEGTLPGSFFPSADRQDKNEAHKDCIRKDNFAYLLAEKLEKAGMHFYWSWTGAKIGYGRFDEGLAVFSRFPLLEADAFYYSNGRDYSYWKTRRCVGICAEIEGQKVWFYSVHMGWWKDDEEPFVDQMDRLQAHMKEHEGLVFLMGDFNSQADISGEGYDYVRKLGWKDSYELAEKKDSGITVPGTIDGWTDVESGMRIDYIFSNKEIAVKSSAVVFKGADSPVISDHFGLLIEISSLQEGE